MVRPNRVPDEASLREAALAHLALYPTTAAGLERVLLRRVARSLRALGAEAIGQEAAARAAVEAVIRRLVGSGVLDDAVFARARARRLARGGKSRRAIAAHLAAHGVTGATIHETLSTDADAELAACLVFTRRRKIGPFREAVPMDSARRVRELALCARAGFTAAITRRALALDRGEAEERIRAAERLP